jgi:hypothetical protein
VRLAMTLASVACAALPAAAGDVIIMPFSCTLSNGKPVLTPTRDVEAHRVLGPREQRKVKTCSTVDPKRCRQWTAFKFDMDCGGARVAWMQVYANASEHTRRRVTEAGGSLRVADTPQRSRRVDDMCARRMSDNMEWWSVNEICDQASPLNAPTSTDMPAGFAPMVGLDASVLPEDALRSRSQRLALAKAGEVRASTEEHGDAEAAKAKREAGTDSTAAANAGERAESEPKIAATRRSDGDVPKPSAVQRPAEVVVPEARAPEPSAQSSTAAATEPDAGLAATTPAQSVPAAADAAGSPTPVSGAATAAATVSIINKAAPAPGEGAADHAQAAGSSRPAREPAIAAKTDRLAPTDDHNAKSESEVPTRLAMAPASHNETVVTKRGDVPEQVAVVPAIDDKRADEATAGSPGVTGSIEREAAAESETPAEPKASVLGFAIAGFATAAMVMTALVLNWLYRTPAKDGAGVRAAAGANPAESDVSQGAVATGGSGVLVPVARSVPMRTRGPSRVAPSALGDRAGLGDRMPSSRPEALAVLGMGVVNDGNLASLKKIIDGLRMNWHPDLAQDDGDRLTREVRLKQINAAWEILQGAEA